MELPDSLVSEVRSGRVVLFLGAGASFGSSTPNENSPPSGLELRDMLSQRFLGGKYGQEPLAWVSELAISATDLGTVQDLIADQFQDLEPGDFYHLLPTFKWRGLVTTNYDRLVERIYERAKEPVQELVPFISNHDRVDEKLRSLRHLGLLKLHGCITRTHDPNLPLILTADQYTTHRTGRDRLFRTFYEWGIENTVVFVGHALQDPDLRAILLEVSRELSVRPRYYLIKPDATQVERDLWAEKRITVLKGTFEGFLNYLDKAIPEAVRPLAQVIDIEHPIEKKFVVYEPLGDSIKDLLFHDVQYIHSGLESEEGSPKRFYKGFDLGWYPILNGLDVKRRLAETVLWDVIMRPEKDRPVISELYVIKAEAGAGKTVFLRRLAWEAATQGEVLCLFARHSCAPHFEAIRELYRVTNERIFLFIDLAADNTSLIANMIEEARRFHVPLTIITAERVNEWNMFCEDISGYVSDEYRLRYLNHDEIEQLVNLLRKHDALGPWLQGKPFEDQVKEFEEKAGRQLLVALHEATMGRPFEEILFDEYNNIYPQQAQNLYLTVCLLNRLNIPVRAGLIARVHGISFTEFQKKLFAPLEHVVQVKRDQATNDFAYVARHPEIAQIVFEMVLTDASDRFNKYVRVLKKLNIAYNTDRESFRKLIQAKALHELFPRYEDVKAIYVGAKEIASGEAYLYQQMANYERIRPDGNYNRAYELLLYAQKLEPRDTSVVHTLAELSRTRALHTPRPIERRKYRNEARSFLKPLLNNPQADRYARHTLVKLAIDDLEDLLKQEESTDRDIDDAIRNVERVLEGARQKYPKDYFLDTSEADFGRLLEDHDRSLMALQSAFNINPRDPYIATRLARIYENKNDIQTAKACLSKALENNRGNKLLNYRYAQILRSIDASDIDNIAYYFKRAFTRWDHNHEAQFWYARYIFENADPEKQKEAKDIFAHLRTVPMSHEARIKLLDSTIENEHQKVFRGTIFRLEVTHGFVTTDGRGDNIFLHKDDIKEATWAKLRAGSRIAFCIGFTFGGPKALRIEAV